MTGPVFNAGAIEASARIDRTQFIADLRAMQADIATFQHNPINLSGKIDRNAIKNDLRALKAELSGTSAIKLDIGGNTAQAKRDVAEFRAYVKGLNAVELSIGANLGEARRNIAAYRTELKNSGATNINVGANVGPARRDITALRALIAGYSANINVNAKTLAALAALQQVNQQTNQLNGKTATVNVKTGRDTGYSNTLIAAIGAGITGLIYLAPAAAAGIAGVVAAASVGAQSFGALAFGLSGVKAAYQALAQNEQQAASQQGVSHSGVESAQRSLTDARLSAARSAISSAQAITDAERSADHTQITSMQAVEDAKRSQQRTIEDSNQAIADAQLSLQRTIVTGGQSIEDAQRALDRAYANQSDAVNALNEARQQEIYTLEDLKLKLRDAALDEAEAQTAVERALQHMRILQRDPLATPLQIKEGQDAIERANLTLDEAKQKQIEVKDEATKAAQAGVDGSSSVVAAIKQVAQANQQVEASQRSLDRTRAQSLQQEQDAQQRLDKAREQSLIQQEDAQRAVTRAIDDSKYAQESAQLSISKAIDAQKDQQEQSAHAIEDALARVSDAQETAANTGIKSFNQLEYAMSKLSPEGRSFVHFLYDEVRPAINSISDEVAGNMLPAFTRAGRILLTLGPDIKAGLGETGQVLGDLSIQGARLVTSGPFRRDFAEIMHANNLMLGDVGRSALLGVDGVKSLYLASTPILQTFTLWANKSAILFDEWVRGKATSGELAQFFQVVGERAKEVWDLFVKLVDTSIQLGVALSPVGKIVVEIATGFLSLIQWLNSVNPEILTFIGYAALVAVTLSRVNKGLLQLFSYSGTATAGFKKLGDSISNAALGAGTFTEKVTGSATAGEKVATAGDKVGNAVSKAATALGLFGFVLAGAAIIQDQFAVNQDKVVEGLMKGGQAAEDASHAYDHQNIFAKILTGSIVGIGGGLKEATAEFERQRQAMDPLTRAQSDATRAQADYNLAVEKFGQESPQALEAANRWKDATKQASDVQADMRNKLISATDALIAQRDEMLGAIDTDIRFKDQLKTLTDQVDEHGKTTDRNTDAGRRNWENLQNLSRTLIQYSDDLAKNGSTTDEVKQKTQGYKDQLYNAAIQIGMTKEQARQYVDQLHLIPDSETTNVFLNMGDARNVLQDYINKIGYLKNLGPIQTTLNLATSIAAGIPHARGGIDLISVIPHPQVVGMASGGLRTISSGIATVIPPNTPTLMGDNKTVNESYIPWVKNERTQHIFDVTGIALGRTVLPVGVKPIGMSNGGIVDAPETEARKFIKEFSVDTSDTTGLHSIVSKLSSSSSPRSVSNINASISTAIANTQTHQNNGPVIGTVVMQIPYGSSPKEYVEHLDFELQYRRKKGVYKR